MAEYIFQRETISELADIFRHKTKSSSKLSVEDMRKLIYLLHYNVDNGVTFYDINEEPIYSCSIQEAQTLTEFPEPSVIAGHYFANWNCSLEDINTTTEPLKVFSKYYSDNTSAVMLTTMTDSQEFTFAFTQSDANGTLLDWGDGSDAESFDAVGEITSTHTYATRGDYTISLKSVNGSISFESQIFKQSNFLSGANECVNKIVLGNNIRNLSNAFVMLEALQEVKILNGLISIGSSTFADCIGLTKIDIPNGVTEIGERAFAGCSNLNSITIPKSVTSIGMRIIATCDALTNIIFTGTISEWNNINKHSLWVTSGYSFMITCIDGIIIIDDGEVVLYDPANTSIFMLTTPSDSCDVAIQFNQTDANDTLIDWGDGSDVETLNTSGLVKASHTYATAGNYRISLKSQIGTISFPQRVSYNMESYYKKTILGKNVTSIGDYAFDGWQNLLNITIFDTVTTIGMTAFRNCTSLTSVTIPNSVTNIGASPFGGCMNLTNITVDKNNAYYKSVNGNIYNIDGTELIQYAVGKKETSFTIPNGVTSINNYAFSGCQNLTNITIPNSVSNISPGVFSDCINLIDITVPDSVTSINSSVFYGCTSLISVTLPSTVTTIGSSAFKNCTSLTSITLPESLKDVETHAFENLKGLTEIRFNAVAMNDLSYISFMYAGSNTEGITLTIGKNVTKIPARLFAGCGTTAYKYPRITTVNFEEGGSCTSIGTRAFYDCNALTSINIPIGITAIEAGTFNSCDKLATIGIPNTVTSMGEKCLAWCSKLTTINFGGTIAEWNAIIKGTNWNNSTGSYTIICTDGTVNK